MNAVNALDEQPAPPPTTRARTLARLILAGAMIFAGLSHLFWAREEFQAQVPDWVPMDADGVVMASGGVEITLGVGLAVLRRDRVLVGRLLAAFFVLVFPGNLAQYLKPRRRVRARHRHQAVGAVVLPAGADRVGAVVHGDSSPALTVGADGIEPPTAGV